jgi:transcriptional/translational regulatory protein YebC/TACO1
VWYQKKNPPDFMGQHFDLSKFNMPDLDMATKESQLYSFTQKAAVEFTKGVDRMILNAIIQKAIENGITDLYVLNEDFIVSAIREKMAREGSDK